MPKKCRNPKKPPGDRWFVYLLRCADASLYTGITKDVKRRCQQHNDGTASRYTRNRLSVVVVYEEAHTSRSLALKQRRRSRPFLGGRKWRWFGWLGESEGNKSMARSNNKNILFLCTGNYYRSRFAECLFNSVAGKMGLPWRASSKGLALERGINNVGPMAVSALKALEAMGLSAVNDFARFPAQVTLDDLEQADWTVALKEAEHLPLLQERFPAWAEKVEFWQVDDAPDVLGLIEREVMDLVARLKRTGG